jgi:CheY-like chemotaxis protein
MEPEEVDKTYHFLVIDDQPEICEVVSEILDANFPNSKIDVATNAVKALEYCRNNEYTLICVDYIMPGMNGIEFIYEIRNGEDDLNKDVGIALVTAMDIDIRSEIVKFDKVDIIDKIDDIPKVLKVLNGLMY